MVCKPYILTDYHKTKCRFVERGLFCDDTKIRFVIRRLLKTEDFYRFATRTMRLTVKDGVFLKTIESLKKSVSLFYCCTLFTAVNFRSDIFIFFV